MATLPNSKPKLADERVRLQSLLGSQELERLLKLETIELNRALANFPEVDRLAIKRERRACKRKVDDKTYADKQKATLGQQTQPATQDSLAHHPSTIPGNEAAAGLLRGDGIPTIFAPVEAYLILLCFSKSLTPTRGWRSDSVLSNISVWFCSGDAEPVQPTRLSDAVASLHLPDYRVSDAGLLL
eukprot:m.188198 g.188198  ORF g.188198 m.188198 type:complete len:185 (-) comp53594_c1_seq19:668-1222(-)